jgi:serine/threonine protein phosphatase PrpC
MTVVVRSATDVGRVRAVNQDSYAWVACPDGDSGVLLVVADGMGGARAGGLASRTAVDRVVARFATASDPHSVESLKEALLEANSRVYSKSLTRPEWHGMGTTCTALLIVGSDLLVAHVGDSRAYLVHSGSLIRLTDDHSLVAEMVREGRLTQEEARVHPRRNIVTRAVGVENNVEVDAMRYDGVLEPGDAVLLCSDGLHGVLTEDEILNVTGMEDREQVCTRLVELANQRGGPDNITVLLAWRE